MRLLARFVVTMLAVAQFAQGAEPRITTPFRSSRDVTYREVGNEKLQADVFRPDDDRSHPAVLLIHGGAWSSGDKWHMHDHARQLAQSGFVAVSINYRLAPRHLIEAQVDDCRTALRWLADSSQEYGVDRERIAVWGYSAGAHLACLISAKPESGEPRIAATVAGGAPCDFANIPPDSQLLSMVMGGTPREKPKLYHDVAPINFANASCPATFFYHGTKDAIVPPKSSRDMEQKLRGCGVVTTYYDVSDQGHLSTFIDPVAKQKAIKFLNQHLKSDH